MANVEKWIRHFKEMGKNGRRKKFYTVASTPLQPAVIAPSQQIVHRAESTVKRKIAQSKKPIKRRKQKASITVFD